MNLKTSRSKKPCSSIIQSKTTQSNTTQFNTIHYTINFYPISQKKTHKSVSLPTTTYLTRVCVHLEITLLSSLYWTLYYYVNSGVTPRKLVPKFKVGQKINFIYNTSRSKYIIQKNHISKSYQPHNKTTSDTHRAFLVRLQKSFNAAKTITHTDILLFLLQH